ncbi:MAG: S-adenosylmethionine-dependent methyltransferase [Phylliscum demangeonii]|nr:MAG: S-adenosylmethionine-dependent methyltransferase [Phylliscum demangeonii]
MLPTPSTSHLSFEKIYEPSEDSFLLLDTLSSDGETGFLRSAFASSSSSSSSCRHHTTACPLILEIGSGSGVVLAFVAAHAATILGRRDVLAWAMDVNGFACRATHDTVAAALISPTRLLRPVPVPVPFPVLLGPTLADLGAAVRPGVVDVLICNPPYVPTSEVPPLPAHGDADDTPMPQTAFEREAHLLALAYAGGAQGMQVTNRLLAQIPQLLRAPSGVAYVVLCAQNQPERVKEGIRAWPGGWCAETVGESGKKGGWEKLVVVRIWRRPPGSGSVP